MSEAASEDKVGEQSRSRTGGAPASLPVESGGVRVDDRGFRRLEGPDGPVIAWDEVSCVTASGSRVTVEGRGDESGPTRVLMSFRAGREDARAVEAAWRERVLASLARGEPLEGTVRAGAAWVPRAFLVLSLLMLASAVADAWIVRKTASALEPVSSTSLRTFGPADPAGGFSGEHLSRVVRVAGWAFMVGAAAAAVVLLSAAVRLRRALADWRKWRLTGDGLTYWPVAAGTRCERYLLRPLAGDVFTPESARMNERRVPLRWMSASTLVTPLLLAWGVRAQSDVWRDSVAELILTPAFAAGLFVLALVTRVLVPAGPVPALVTAALGAALAVVWGVLFVRSGRTRTRLLEEGARMLERLGW